MPDQKKADDDASIALMSKRFKKVAEVIGTEKAVAVLNVRSASRQDPRFGEAIFPVWGNVSPFWGMCLAETLLVGCLSTHPTLSASWAGEFMAYHMIFGWVLPRGGTPAGALTARSLISACALEVEFMFISATRDRGPIRD